MNTVCASTKYSSIIQTAQISIKVKHTTTSEAFLTTHFIMIFREYTYVNVFGWKVRYNSYY